MKSLLKLLIACIGLTLSTESYAQNVGIKGGLNLSTMQYSSNNYSFEEYFKLNPGFHFGVTFELPIKKIFSFETGLFASTKGYRIAEKYSSSYGEQEVKYKINILSIEIPFTAKATFDLGPLKIYSTIGPYIGYSVYGIATNTTITNGKSTTQSEDFNIGYDPFDEFEPLDFGLVAGAGIDIKKIQVGISYNLGLANLSKSDSNGSQIRYRTLGISVGYKFGN